MIQHQISRYIKSSYIKASFSGSKLKYVLFQRCLDIFHVAKVLNSYYLMPPFLQISIQGLSKGTSSRDLTPCFISLGNVLSISSTGKSQDVKNFVLVFYSILCYQSCLIMENNIDIVVHTTEALKASSKGRYLENIVKICQKSMVGAKTPPKRYWTRP